MSTIHFIGGEKGGLGKSVGARLVAQRCIDKNLPVVAFDADGSHGALLRHFANFASPIDLAQFESTVQIMGAAQLRTKTFRINVIATATRWIPLGILRGAQSLRCLCAMLVGHDAFPIATRSAAPNLRPSDP